MSKRISLKSLVEENGRMRNLVRDSLDCKVEMLELALDNKIMIIYHDDGVMNTTKVCFYEFIHKDVKSWTRRNGLFRKIKWSSSPKDILKYVLKLSKQKGAFDV